MKAIPEKIIHFLLRHNFTIVSTIDRKGAPHSSCKGIVKLDGKKGKVYLLDLYRQRTYTNLTLNPSISVTAVDEHRFCGWCLKGSAKIIERKDFDKGLEKAWEQRLSKRITQRILKNITGEKGHPAHPETQFPRPAYLIEMDVDEIVDLTPEHIK